MKLLWFLPAVFLFDVILGGPLGLLPLPLGRHMLFLLAMVGLLLLALRRRGLVAAYAIAPLGLICGFLLWNGVWLSFVPMYHGHSLRLALAEGDAYAVLGAVPLFVAAGGMHWATLRRMLWIMLVFALALAAVQFMVWLAGMAEPAWQGLLRHALLRVYGHESMYVGRMPDGFFRVFWISSLWLIPAFFYAPLLVHSRTQRWIFLIIISGAILGTYSRGIWLGLLLGAFTKSAVHCVGVMRLRFRPRRILAGFVAGSIVLVSGSFMFGDAVVKRLEGLSSVEDASMSDRVAQVRPLLEAWAEHPILGGGYGAYASLERDPANPYSYEVVPLALLMKLGLIGMVGFAAFLMIVMVSALCRAKLHSREAAAMLASFVAFMVATMTNPFLINFVGMGVMAILLIHWIFLFRPHQADDKSGTDRHKSAWHWLEPPRVVSARHDNP